MIPHTGLACMRALPGPAVCVLADLQPTVHERRRALLALTA